MTASVDDERAIRHLAGRFSDAVTRGDEQYLASLFADDGVWLVPGLGATSGRDAIAGVLRGLLDSLTGLVQLLHQGFVDVDGDQATARWYLSEFGTDREGRGVHFVGTYHDRLRRDDDGWHFVERRFDFLQRAASEGRSKAYAFPDDLNAPPGADNGT